MFIFNNGFERTKLKIEAGKSKNLSDLIGIR